jgi:hypothetical protein
MDGWALVSVVGGGFEPVPPDPPEVDPPPPPQLVVRHNTTATSVQRVGVGEEIVILAVSHPASTGFRGNCLSLEWFRAMFLRYMPPISAWLPENWCCHAKALSCFGQEENLPKGIKAEHRSPLDSELRAAVFQTGMQDPEPPAIAEPLWKRRNRRDHSPFRICTG